MPDVIRFTKMSRNDGGETVNVIVDSSPPFVIVVGEADMLTDCARNDEMLINVTTQNKTRTEERDRIFIALLIEGNTGQ